MSVLAEIYAATNDDQALQYDEQPTTFTDRAQFTGFTVLELSTLWAILRGTKWDVSLLSEFTEVFMEEEGERSIFRLPDGMCRALTRLTDSDISTAAAKWAATDELHCSPADVQPIIESLVGLARDADKGSRKLYFWNCI